MKRFSAKAVKRAQAALDATVRAARGQAYKGFQIGETLFFDRSHPGAIDLGDHETYRCESKRWRDELCERLVGTVSRSNDRWQDSLFTRASTPRTMAVLGAENRRLGGVVEAHTFKAIGRGYAAIASLLDAVETSKPSAFSLALFLAQCRTAPLCRVAERVFEVGADAVIGTMVELLGVRVEVSVGAHQGLVARDRVLQQAVLGLAAGGASATLGGRVSRVGKTNANDGGVDLISNYGFAAAVTHADLDARRAGRLANLVGLPRAAVVCRSAKDPATPTRVPVITEGDLVRWSDQIVRGDLGSDGPERLRARLVAELRSEFPAVRADAYAAFIAERGYHRMPDWVV